MISEHDPNGMFPFGLRIMDYDSGSKLSVYCFDTDEDLYEFTDSKQACDFLDKIDISGIVYSVVYVTDDKIKSTGSIQQSYPRVQIGEMKGMLCK